MAKATSSEGFRFTDGWVVAIATAIAVPIALLSAWAVVNQNRLIALDMLVRLEERFSSSEDMKHYRKSAARAWLVGGARPWAPEVYDVLNFLDGVASFVNRHRVQKTMRLAAWVWFGPPVRGYVQAFRAGIDHLEEDDPDVYRELKKLAERFSKLDARRYPRRRRASAARWSDEALRGFMKAELLLYMAGEATPVPQAPAGTERTRWFARALRRP